MLDVMCDQMGGVTFAPAGFHKECKETAEGRNMSSRTLKGNLSTYTNSSFCHRVLLRSEK
jgi:hypothetical protein